MKIWAYASAGAVAAITGVTAYSLSSTGPSEPASRSITPAPAPVSAPCEVLDLRAWVNRQPGQAISLIVTGRVNLPDGEGGPVTVETSLDEPTGVLSLAVSGSGDDPPRDYAIGFRYEEPARVRYSAVRVTCGGVEAARQDGVPRVT